MKDRLKTFVDQHRQEFESYQTDFEGAWEKVKGQTSLKKRRWRKHAWKVAASIILLSGLSFLLYQYASIHPSSAEEEAMVYESSELAEIEQYYAEKINAKIQLIYNEDIEVDKELLDALSLSDSSYLQLKEDLKDGIANEEVIHAMIQSYRLKLNILEELLNEIKQNKENDAQVII